MLDTLERERVLCESIIELGKVNKQLAKLTVRKEELTADIIAALGHAHEGQKSYEYGEFKIECKTPMTYSLNKKAYENGHVYIPAEFDPIRSSASYTVDKKLCEQYMQTAPLSVREALGKLITKKEGKASVTVKARV
jgi:hypothetical protein